MSYWLALGNWKRQVGNWKKAVKEKWKMAHLKKNFLLFLTIFDSLVISSPNFTVSRCLLEDCNVGKFATELARLLKEKPSEKTTFVDLCSSYLEAFQTMLACSTQDKNTI